MNTSVIITITLLFFGVLGGMVFLVMRQLKKTDPANIDTSTSGDIETAQEFLPFKDIRDGVIDLGGHEYRAILECTSIDYFLKTTNERGIIESSLQRFLNSLTSPISILIQTKVIDDTKLLKDMEKELIEAIKAHPQMEEYANVYYNEMSNLPAHMGNNYQKKKYIIVPYNEAIELDDLSDEEKYEYSIEEVRQRALMLSDNLSTTGVKSKLLDTAGLAELVYSTYHKDDYTYYENIVDGEGLALIVEGESSLRGSETDDMKMDAILHEAQKRIENEVTNKEIPDYLKEEYSGVLKEIDGLRDRVGAYYKR